MKKDIIAARLTRSRVKCRSGAITVAIFTLIASLIGGLYTGGVHTHHVSGVQAVSKVMYRHSGTYICYQDTL